jgi:primosomal protein N' (replication factor Y)
VRVPFGHGERIGIVLAQLQRSSLTRAEIKTIVEVIDEGPCIDRRLLEVGVWAAVYYQYPIGEVLAAMLPARMRRGLNAATPKTYQWVLTAEGSAAADCRGRRQREIMDLCRAGVVTEHALGQIGFDWRRAVRSLEQKRWIERRVSADEPVVTDFEAEDFLILNKDQNHAVEKILASLQSFSSLLLHGVTGSGKTEVYLYAMREILASQGQVLMLVPEIALTKQLVDRFALRFGSQVAVLHSGLTDAARYRTWEDCRAGRAAIVMGTRSAVWAPLPRLGLIIVDEEHDASFKQHEGFRYSARDVATYRARLNGIPIVLGSATPSLESFHNVARGKFQYLSLPQRVSEAVLPTLECIDVRGVKLAGGLSNVLIGALEKTLADGHQAILFLNRRGYAPLVLCHGCGVLATCDRCDAKLVMHLKRAVLECHHCGATKRLDRLTPCCDEPQLISLGLGTERIEETLRSLFPDRAVARVDRDTMRRRGAIERVFEDVRKRRIDILVGTQMLAKGHDFSGIALVGVLEADSRLYSADFRAEERLAQLIVQVAGRAGRSRVPGRVFIQTHHPEHPLFRDLINDGYDAFARRAMAERRAAELPPFGAMAVLRAESTSQSQPREFLEELRESFTTTNEAAVRLSGPFPAPMEKRAGRFRAQMIATSTHRGGLAVALRSMIAWIEKSPRRRQVRWSVDVDPQDTM